MSVAVLAPTKDPNMFFVKKVLPGENPDPRNPKFMAAPPEVKGPDSNGYTWVYHNQNYREYVDTDRYSGWSNPERRHYAKSKLDQWFGSK